MICSFYVEIVRARQSVHHSYSLHTHTQRAREGQEGEGGKENNFTCSIKNHTWHVLVRLWNHTYINFVCSKNHTIVARYSFDVFDDRKMRKKYKCLKYEGVNNTICTAHCKEREFQKPIPHSATKEREKKHFKWSFSRVHRKLDFCFASFFVCKLQTIKQYTRLQQLNRKTFKAEKTLWIFD